MTDFTESEREAFLIVKTILRQKFASTRITYRDTNSYLNVLLDDNKNKTVCRLWLNGAKLYISFLDEAKKDVRSELGSLDDIYKFADQIIAVATQLDAKKAGAAIV